MNLKYIRIIKNNYWSIEQNIMYQQNQLAKNTLMALGTTFWSQEVAKHAFAYTDMTMMFSIETKTLI